MKRSYGLTALAIVISLAASSAAHAQQAKPAKKPAKPTLVAQNDPAPSDTQPAPAPAPADPAPADPAPAATPPQPEPTTVQPAISIGTGTTTPATDTTQAAAEEPKKPKPRPFAGTQLYATTSATTSTFFKNQTQYNNPTVSQAIWFLPRYTINDAFQVRGRMIFSYEYTNSDDTVTRNEPRFSDTTLQLFYRKIPAVLGIKPQIAANLGLPTSPESRARTMAIAPGATLQLSKVVEHVLGGELLFLNFYSYSHPIYRSQNPEVRTPAPYAFQCAGGSNGCQDLLSGVQNPSDTLAYAFLVTGEWGKFSPALYYLGASQWTYSPPNSTTYADVVPGVNDTRVIPGSTPQGPNAVRQTSYFSAWLDYNVNSYFTAEVGYWLSRSVLAGDGKYGNPFFDRYQDMRVYLGANFNVDNFVKALEGGDTDAGIVRAKNTKQPMWSF
jgi:hypothetical protein